MDPSNDKMKVKITLNEEEQTVFEFDFREPIDSELVLDGVLYARILTTKKVWLSTLQRQMVEHWNKKFLVIISEDEDMVVLTFRLPFMSKTKKLAEALGNKIGEFIEVFEDSLFEGCGPFLRIRVKIDVTKPLMRESYVHNSNIQTRETFTPVLCHEFHYTEGDHPPTTAPETFPSMEPDTFTDLTCIYIPISRHGNCFNTIATYPPLPKNIMAQNICTLSMPLTNATASPSLIVSTRMEKQGKENCSPNCNPKKQQERDSLRDILKRCRAEAKSQPHNQP
uniref:Uncharacterized protein n=1 Tax=Cannabis sativa TaxID=3483 RepID=A0A803QAY6_CANSA